MTGGATVTITDGDLHRVNIVLITVPRVLVIGSSLKTQSPGIGIDGKECLIVTTGDRVGEGVAFDIGRSDISYGSGVFIDGKFHHPNQFRRIIDRGYRDGDATRVG